MTKQAFIAAYQTEVVARYPWATNATKLARFMGEVRVTLYTDTNAWIADGEATKAAWQSIGGKGKPTLKALRALAD